MNEFEIAHKINEYGGRLYIVGGAIRDEIMGFESQDKDYCVTGISVDEFASLFPSAKIIGKDFPVFMLYGSEFALARKERKVASGYKGFSIETSKSLTIEDDLKRRDITINAIAKEVLTGEIIDPFFGIEDIKNKKIRHISNSFAEDPLRVYRVARFAAKLEFNVDNETLKLMNSLKSELVTITPERVFVELNKALTTRKPSIFFKVLKNANVLDVHFKEIYDLIGIPQPEKYHPEGDVFNHTMIVLDKVSSKSKENYVRFSALVHDLGKAITPKNILPQHIGHEEAGIKLVEDISNRLKLPNKWKKSGKEVAKYHMKAGICTTMRPYKQAQFFNLLYRSKIGLDNMQIISDSDDMLDRPKINYSKIAIEVLSQITGKTLIDEGIYPSKVGKENFFSLLLQRQAELIKEKEEKYYI